MLQCCHGAQSVNLRYKGVWTVILPCQKIAANYYETIVMGMTLDYSGTWMFLENDEYFLYDIF